MVALETKQPKEEKEAIETGKDGKLLFRVPRLIPHMTAPDRVTIAQWHIQEGDIVNPGDEMVTFDFLGDDWHLSMPLLGPLRVLKIEVAQGNIVHLHDPLILLEPIQSAAYPQSCEKGCSEF